jgi:ABC-type branched-subunit amino acid transport system permease subunit
MVRKAILVTLALAVLAIPFAGSSNYILRLVNVALIYALLAVSLNIVLGYAGQLALGHAALFGIGAYTAALLTAGGSGLLFWPAFLMAGLITGISGLLIGIPTLRLKGHYLALATLGFGEIMRHIFFNWREVTHGMDGISGIPAPSLGWFVIRNDRSFFYVVLFVLALVMRATIRLQRSKYGRQLAAIRDAELAAGTSGVHVPRLKIIAFTISAVIAGFAGSLYAHLVTYISPDVFVLRCRSRGGWKLKAA